MTEQTLCTTESQTAENGHTEVKPIEKVPVFRPAVDLVDSGDVIILWADLPGVDENTVDITVENKVLTLRATVQPPEFEGKKPLLREYAVGNYERTFTISDEIDRERIEATVSHGVLKLVLPKTRQAATHKVTVKAG